MFNNEKLNDFGVLKTEELDLYKSNQSIKIDQEAFKTEEVENLKTDRILLTERGREEDFIINNKNDNDNDFKIEETKLPLIKKVIKTMKKALNYTYFDRLTPNQINLINDQSFFQRTKNQFAYVNFFFIKLLKLLAKL